MIRRCILALSLALGVTSLRAQTADRDLPNGKELVAVYIGASTCGPCMTADVKAAVAKANVLLSAWAKAHGYAFSAMGVSTDWSTADGLEFLKGNGPFDQLVVGGNWANLGAERFIWSDAGAQPAMPQIVLVERTVTLGDRISISAPRVVKRVFGSAEIPAWVASGAPVEMAAVVR
jgi:thiol-disulfide isomerase/thioredoxin